MGWHDDATAVITDDDVITIKILDRDGNALSDGLNAVNNPD